VKQRFDKTKLYAKFGAKEMISLKKRKKDALRIGHRKN
jgi:hypothetical protein